jgi:hypothetical protein
VYQELGRAEAVVIVDVLLEVVVFVVAIGDVPDRGEVDRIALRPAGRSDREQAEKCRGRSGRLV